MGYLLTEIVVYLVIAGLIGFAFGWLVRDGALDKYFDKLIGLIKNIWAIIIGFFGKIKSYFSNLEIFKKSSETKEASDEDTKETAEDFKESKEEVAVEKVAEVIKEEVKTEEPKVETLEETVTEITKEVEVATPSETVELTEDVSKPTLLTKAPESGQDKLSFIKGIGPVLEKKLNELGVYSFEQIASWDIEQELWIGTQMAFPKRVTKEEWVKQAKELLNAK